MTDRYNALTVVLDRDTRSDDAESIINAIQMVKGVCKVVPHQANLASYVATEIARRELTEKLWQVLRETPAAKVDDG